MAEVLRTVDLVKRYGERTVVDQVSLSVGAGEVVGLLGPNGAGKTTTFQMIVGMVRPSAGEIYLGGEAVAGMPMYRRARRGIGYLPQEESIFRRLSVQDNLQCIIETLPLPEAEKHQRCEDLLKEFGIEHLRASQAYQLSGGEKRRLTIARCLATEPSILLLDEPFSGVDPIAVQDIQDIIRLLSARGLAVLITDHNVRETLSVVDRAYLIYAGRIERQGNREFLVNDPIARQLYLGERFNM
jgi:lipopolysaccharide export system ATP-binding protein